MIDQIIGLIKKLFVKKGSGVGDSIGINGKYASVKDFYNENGLKRLEKQLKISFAKRY